MVSSSFCLIRKFNLSDQQAVKDIIIEATMEQVNNFFWRALTSEMLPQVAVLLIAVCYILVGIPLKFCLLAIPLAIVFLYMLVWTGHWIKANELSNDIGNISVNYMTDPNTMFFVAEMYGKSGEAELASEMMNKVKKIEYDFYTEKEFATQSLNIKGLSKFVVGSIGITQSLNNSDSAWIRRMAVKQQYRRRGVASHLLTDAIKFCESRRFKGVELITTECHREAQQLYLQEGFEEMAVSHKSYFGMGASQVVNHMYRKLSSNDTADDKEASFMESGEVYNDI